MTDRRRRQTDRGPLWLQAHAQSDKFRQARAYLQHQIAAGQLKLEFKSRAADK